MEIAHSIYSGAGNIFVMIDGRKNSDGILMEPATVSALCSMYGTDGLMILDDSDTYDFSMRFFNPDGSTGMMCGNGGRCIAAFAVDLGISPAEGNGRYIFEGPDCIHTAEILHDAGRLKTVRLGMKDVLGISGVKGGYFLNTGARHFVVFTDNIEGIDVAREGSGMRHSEEFAPEGANVDFVRAASDGSLEIRTYEKGVEAETLACGTGIVAAAIAAFHCGIRPAHGNGREHYSVKARRNTLEVDFTVPDSGECIATDVFLTGPAEKLG